MDLNPAIQSFLAESNELLTAMETALLEYEHSQDQRSELDAIFRAAHTIKGSAGIFGFEQVVAFTHQVENLLDRMRDETLRMDADSRDLLLKCADHMRELVAAGVAESTLDAESAQRGTELTAVLAQKLGVHIAPATSAYTEHLEAASEALITYRIHLSFGESVLRNGMDPLSFVRYLTTIGTLSQVEISSARVPSLADLDPESCFLDIALCVLSAAPLSTIESAFDFVRDDCAIEICQDAVTDPEAPPNRVTDDHPSVAPLQVIDTAATPVRAKSSVDTRNLLEARLIRVDADKLDQLINLVGELVTAGAATLVTAQRSRAGDVVESAAVVSRLVAEVRDCALGLRMVQIGSTFQRFQRVVHELSRSLGKAVELQISGGDTELDKSVVEKIADPLVHLVRNALDHGLETADERVNAGKPAQGTLRLHAYHDSGSIVIEVADDGRGLSRERIFAKAVAQGLVSPGATLSERETFALIFEAGFSTADAVSDLSGRGVGMDVVRRNIEQVRGTVEVESAAGLGTTVSIRLPLTLAIIDGFLIGVEQARFVVPLEAVVECVALSPTERAEIADRGFINMRGEVLPVLALREVFGSSAPPPSRQNIVVVRAGAAKAGIVVDELLGEFQTVVKPLGKLFVHLKGISGATLLGSGEVALILDIPGLVQRATARSVANVALCA